MAKGQSKTSKAGATAAPEAVKRLDMSELIKQAEASPRNLHEMVWAVTNVHSDYENALSRVREAYGILTAPNGDQFKSLALGWIDEALKSIGY